MKDFIKRDFDSYFPFYEKVGYPSLYQIISSYTKARKRYEKRCLKRGIVNRVYK